MIRSGFFVKTLVDIVYHTIVSLYLLFNVELLISNVIVAQFRELLNVERLFLSRDRHCHFINKC